MATIDYAQYLKHLPVAPHIAAKILDLAEKKDFSYTSLEQLIAVDPGLTAKILRIANSSQFARQHEIKNLRTAMTLVGINTIKNLVILITGSSLLPKTTQGPFYKIFWKHSILSAFLSRDLALKYGFKDLAETAFVAGLLHNIGQVALYLSDPSPYERLVNDAATGKGTMEALEEAALGTSHKMVGHQVLSVWNFPKVYSDTAREHGNPNITSEHKQTIILVSTAGILASNLGGKATSKPLDSLFPYLPFLGVGLPMLSDFQGTYLEKVSVDPLFQECKEIYSLA